MTSLESKWFSIASSNQDSALEVERINEAIAEVVFNDNKAGQPVYLDLDEEEIEAISNILGIASNDLIDHICDAVRKIHKSCKWENIFNEFAWAAQKWNKADNYEETPPTLALLVELSRAAESMATTINVDGSNYYSRLAVLLKCVGQETMLGNNYREHAINLWSTLREWLVAWDEIRGVSTVPIPKTSSDPSMTSRDFKWAIQMPISQARLRDADRQDLNHMFQMFSLDPVSSISPDVMWGILEDWCTGRYSSKNSKKIWKIEEYRETFVLAAISELRIWSGRRSPNGDGSLGVRLILSRDPLRNSLNFSLELRSDTKTETNSVTLTVGANSTVECDVFGVAPGRFRLSDPESIETNSLISRTLKMSIQGEQSAGERKPRQIIPMRFDGQSIYTEVDRIGMDGVYGILMLQQIQPPSGVNLRKQVEELLTEIARPGWAVMSSDDGVLGLPSGWVFISQVDVMTVSSSTNQLHNSLLVLQPLAMPSLRFFGGLRVPGQKDRWLSSNVPELIVSIPTDDAITILVTDSQENQVADFHLDQRAGVISLKDLVLGVGRYGITMAVNDGEIVRRAMLTLVDASVKNIGAALKPISLAYSLGNMTTPSMMTAVDAASNSGGNRLRGFYFDGSISEVGIEVTPPSTPPWNEKFVVDSAEEEKMRAQVNIQSADQNSCIYTGMHVFELPTWYGKYGAAGSKILGECRGCGISKYFPARPVYKWQKKDVKGKPAPIVKTLRPLDFKLITPIKSEASGRWDAAFDAMCFLRHGKVEDISNITSQIDGVEFVVERFIHGLQSLGHADFKLDRNFRTETWSISPSTVVKISSTKGFLAGFRSAEMVRMITEQIVQIGGTLERFENRDLPCSIIVTVPTPDDFSIVFEKILDPVTGYQIRIVADICALLARGVGSISQLFGASPKIRIPGYHQLKRWDPMLTKWVNADDPTIAGAHQFRGNGNQYTYSEVGIDIDGRVISGSVRTVKHKVAQSVQIPLTYYDESTKQFYARLGAELPGLYGRALVAASGLSPREDTKRRIVIYSGIEPQLASLIFGQLMS